MSRFKLASVFATSLCVLTTSCSTNSSRNPSSEDLSLSQIIAEIQSVSDKRNMTPELCVQSYDNLYQKLFNLAGDSTYYELNDSDKIDFDIQASFMARIALKETFKTFTPEDVCVKSASDVFRGLRYVEDYLIEIRMSKSHDAPAEYVNMTGVFPYLLVNPKYKDDFKSYEDLKSGDVVLSRGNAFSSAAIARIGRNDYQFSHLSFIYKDEDTKDTFATQALIEVGSIVSPIMDVIKGGNSRSVIFRYKDPQISHSASQFMYERVLKEQLTKKNIEYDFSMNFKDDNKLFCSEIVSRGFKTVLPDEDYYPMFKSKFSKGLIPFLNTIGVPANTSNIDTLEVFAPGDIQFDPRFEIVAEWRNPKKMEDARLKDFILTKMFERMDNEGYKFDPSFKMDAASKALWLLRRTPIVKKFLDDKVPLSMNAGQLEMFMALDKVGDAIYKELEKSSLEYARPMTPKEIYIGLDDFFKEDFELYKRYKKGQDVAKPVFHQLFHP